MAYSSWSDSYKGGWGKSSSWGGGKGKGKKGSRKSDWGWEEPQDDRQEAQAHTGRIWNRYQFPKVILKASAHDDRSAFVKDVKRSLSDDVFLGPKNLKKLLTPDSTHLLRRPGVGVSEAVGSVQAGLDVLGALADVELEELASILQDDNLHAALAQLNTHDGSAQHTQKELRAAMATLVDKLASAPRLEELVTKLTIASSRLYLMGTALLPLLLCTSDPEWWVTNIPEGASDSTYLQEWRRKGNDPTRMQKAVAALLGEQHEEDNQRDRGNAATTLFKKRPAIQKASSSQSPARAKGDKKRKASSSPAVSSSQDGKKKKDKSKKEKTSKKKRAKSSSSSSSSTPIKTKKDKKRDNKKDKKKRDEPSASPSKNSHRPATEKEVHLSIHRIGAVSPEGKAVVKETDPVDKVQISDDNETVSSAVFRLMDAQGSKADFPNWDIRVMDEDFVVRSLDAASALARDNPKVVLVRKGG